MCHQIVNYKIKTMKKALLNFPGTAQPRALSKKEMKQVVGGGSCGNATWICGCIDGENNFYPGACGANYCWQTYGGEPWCVRR
jgi:natural product precursor